MGHPDLVFRHFQISWNHDEVWVSKSTKGFPGRFANAFGLGFNGIEKKSSTVFLSPGPGVWYFIYKSFRLLAGCSGVTKRASTGVHGAVAGEI